MSWYQIQKIREQVRRAEKKKQHKEMIECPKCKCSLLRETEDGYLVCDICDYIILN